MNDLTEAALDYAAKGWHVFPLAPNSKRPAIPSHTAGECDGSDPYCAEGHLGWEERSTVDRDEIHALWASGRHGIAIATGPSHLLVVDIDISKVNGAPIGMQSLAQLEARCGHSVPEHTFTVTTPSGGQHRYFRLHPDLAGAPDDLYRASRRRARYQRPRRLRRCRTNLAHLRRLLPDRVLGNAGAGATLAHSAADPLQRIGRPSRRRSVEFWLRGSPQRSVCTGSDRRRDRPSGIGRGWWPKPCVVPRLDRSRPARRRRPPFRN